MKKVKDILRKDNWIKGFWAMDSYGRKVSANNDKAVKFDLEGAIMHCYKGGELTDALARAICRLGGHINSVIVWNDDPDRTWADVERLIYELDI